MDKSTSLDCQCQFNKIFFPITPFQGIIFFSVLFENLLKVFWYCSIFLKSSFFATPLWLIVKKILCSKTDHTLKIPPVNYCSQIPFQPDLMYSQFLYPSMQDNFFSWNAVFYSSLNSKSFFERPTHKKIQWIIIFEKQKKN